MNSRGLADFLNDASQNEKDAILEYNDFYKMLCRIDELFRKLQKEPMQGHPVVSLLYINSHASFLAACRIALSGQTPPTFMVLRGAVESALYALIASKSDRNANIWLKRSQNTAKCRRVFTAANAIKLLEIDPNLAGLARDAIQLAIDFGAHPNVLSVLKNISIKEYILTFNYLNSVPSNQVAGTLAACIEKGLLALQICIHAVPHCEENVPIWEAALETRKEYDKFLVANEYLPTIVRE